MMARRLRRPSPFVSCVGAVVLAAFIVVGCGDESGAIPPSASSAHGDVGGNDPVTMSSYATEVLADGVVTRLEIDAARSQTLTCLAAEGFAAEFTAQDDRLSDLQATSGAPQPGESESALEQRFDSAISRCTGQYLYPVNAAWLQNTAPSEQERMAALVALRECVQPLEIAIPDAEPETLRGVFVRIDDPTLRQDQQTILKGCLTRYAVATATGEG
jgi:hypothetical protein